MLRQVHHLEKFRTSPDPKKARRIAVLGKGQSFGHLPLVLGSRQYLYSATVGSQGCCMLLINKSDYNTILRRDGAHQEHPVRTRDGGLRGFMLRGKRGLFNVSCASHS